MEETYYVISVAAQLAGMHPQTLRQYDRLGLVSPKRTSGRGRRYSARDVENLRKIQFLSQEEGINLAGIRRILQLESELERLQTAMRRAAEIEAARARSAHRVFTADASGRVAEGPRRRVVLRPVAALPPGRG